MIEETLTCDHCKRSEKIPPNHIWTLVVAPGQWAAIFPGIKRTASELPLSGLRVEGKIEFVHCCSIDCAVREAAKWMGKMLGHTSPHDMPKGMSLGERSHGSRS